MRFIRCMMTAGFSGAAGHMPNHHRQYRRPKLEPCVRRSRVSRGFVAAAFVLVAIAGQGCATVAAVGDEGPLIMGGTRLNAALLEDRGTVLAQRGRHGVPVYPLLDLPFSFALDTMMLAWTVPTAAVLYGADRFGRGARDDG